VSLPALDAALLYERRGWAVVPIKPGTKQPHSGVLIAARGSPQWTPLAQDRTAPEEIRSWFKHDPNAGIGLITGVPSDGLCVFDFDRRPVGLRLTPTPLAWTGRRYGRKRGLHAYVHATEPVPSKRFTWGELRAFGSPKIVVAPPTPYLGSSTRSYEWALSPQEAPLADVSDIFVPGVQSPVKETDEREDEPYPQLTCLLGVEDLGEEDDLAAVDKDPRFVRALADWLGVPEVPLGRNFRCLLPGHAELHPSANIWRGHDDVFVYRDHHRREKQSSFALAQVFASVIAGRVVTPRGPSLGCWKLRSLAELGFIEPPAVGVPLLPPTASRAAHRLCEGFRLLLSLRWWREPETPTPYAPSFAGPWCGMAEETARKGKGELVRFGVIVKVDEIRVRGLKMSLYLAGDGTGAVG
jgi:hypothetical protein